MLFNSHRIAVLTNVHEIVIREIRCDIPLPSLFPLTTALKWREVCDWQSPENVFLHYWNVQPRERKPHHGLPASHCCSLRCCLISDTSQHINCTYTITVVCKVRRKRFLQTDIRNTCASHMWAESLYGFTHKLAWRRKCLPCRLDCAPLWFAHSAALSVYSRYRWKIIKTVSDLTLTLDF